MPASVSQHAATLRQVAGQRIMIVEDELMIALTLEEALSDAGAEIVGSCDTLTAAIATANSQTIDAAIVDLHLQGELAFPLIRLLIALKIPVIVISGYAASIMPDDLAQVPYCEKPFRASRILATLAANVRQPAYAAPQPYPMAPALPQWQQGRPRLHRIRAAGLHRLLVQDARTGQVIAAGQTPLD